MANALYDSGRNGFLNGAIDYTNNTIKMALVSDGYTPNLASHNFYNEVSSNVVGTPQTLSSKTTSAGVANCADVDFGTVASGSTVRYILLYKDSGTTSTSQLIALYDTAVGLPFATSGAEIVIKIDSGANKLFKL
jgi:hypothetical protein